MVKNKKQLFIVLGIVVVLFILAVFLLGPKKEKHRATEKPSSDSSASDELLAGKDLGEDSNVVDEYIKEDESKTEDSEDMTTPVKKPSSNKPGQDVEEEETKEDNKDTTDGNIGGGSGSNNSGSEGNTGDNTPSDGQLGIEEDVDQGYGRID